MEILLVSATPFEIAPLLQYLNVHWSVPDEQQSAYVKGAVKVTILVTGVGLAATAYQLGRVLAGSRPGLCLNVGIAGTLDTQIAIGSVVQVVSERFADLGAEDADGSFLDLFDLGLAEPDKGMFANGRMENGSEAFGFLPASHGITVNKAHGNAPSIDSIRQKYPDAQVESMEGAAFFYACKMADTPFLQIRSISNRVETRNREAWNIPLAIANLNQVLIELLEGLAG